MKTFKLIIPLIALVSLATGLIHCGGPQRTNLMEYTLSPGEDTGGMRAPTETGGRIDIGGDDLKLGHPGSKATKTFNCGDRQKCIISISVGSRIPGNRANFVDNEKVRIGFTWGNNEGSSKDYDTAGESYPQTVEIPTCGPITVTITMTEGDNPGIKSQGTVAPITYWCE